MTLSQSLYQDTFEDFLKKVCATFPKETKLLLEETETSPESSQDSQHPLSWAKCILNKIGHTQEFDRAALSLLCFQKAALKDKDFFNTISSENQNALFQLLDCLRNTPEKIPLWTYSILFNDLGKVKSVQNLLKNPPTDHDDIFIEVLKQNPDIFSGFQTFSESQRKTFVTGLSIKFNLGKALQLESAPFIWEKFIHLPEEEKNLLFAHCLFDIMGVTGSKNPKTYSPGLINDTFLKNAFLILKEKSPEKIMTKRFPGSFLSETEKRLTGLFRYTTEQEQKEFQKNYASVSKTTKTLLEKFLSNTLTYSTEPFYSPAFLQNLKKSNISLEDTLNCIGHGLFLGWRNSVLRKNRLYYPLVNFSKIIDHHFPEKILTEKIVLEETPDGGTLIFKPKTTFESLHAFKEETFSDIKNKKCLFLGIGGGSDCLQATHLAHLYGNHQSIIGSIRQRNPKRDNSLKGITQISKDLFQTHAYSSGEDRFLEHLPSKNNTTYLLLDTTHEDDLRNSLNHLIAKEKIEMIIAVDTGGDCLYDPNESDLDTTPDQDQRSLSVLKTLNVPTKVVILGMGIDSPEYAEKSLLEKKAKYFAFTESEKNLIIDTYDIWKNSVKNRWLGKTPLAFEKALIGKRNLTVLEIPEDHCLNSKNPWNPYTYIAPETALGFSYDL